MEAKEAHATFEIRILTSGLRTKAKCYPRGPFTNTGNALVHRRRPVYSYTHEDS